LTRHMNRLAWHMTRILIAIACVLSLTSCGQDHAQQTKPAEKNNSLKTSNISEVDIATLDGVITRDLFARAAKHPDQIDSFLIDSEQANGSRCYYASSYVQGNELAGICVAPKGTFHDGMAPASVDIDPALAPYRAQWARLPGRVKADEQAQVIVAQLAAMPLDVQISRISKTASAKVAGFDIQKLAKVVLTELNVQLARKDKH
jgi:hypothetical protein